MKLRLRPRRTGHVGGARRATMLPAVVYYPERAARAVFGAVADKAGELNPFGGRHTVSRAFLFLASAWELSEFALHPGRHSAAKLAAPVAFLAFLRALEVFTRGDTGAKR